MNETYEYEAFDNIPAIAKGIVISILKKTVIEFRYKEDEIWIRMEPCILAVNKHGQLFISGFCLNLDGDKKKTKKFYLRNIDESSFVITDDSFFELKLPPKKLYKSKKQVVLHMVYFKELIAYVLRKNTKKKKENL
jgi:hypothetical protein